jgi:transposase
MVGEPTETSTRAIDNLDETIAHFDEEIEKYGRPFEEAVRLLDTIPGVAHRTAEVIVSEIGTEMSRFPTANHLAAWAGMAPGNNESAGKRYSGKTRHGDRALTVALVQAAHAAARTRSSICPLSTIAWPLTEARSGPLWPSPIQFW